MGNIKKLLTTGTLTSYRPRTDGSFNITVNIAIPSKEQKGIIDDMFQQEVVVYMREGSEVTVDEIEIIDNIDIELGNSKTPSQRLRNTLYVLWSDKPEGFAEFKEFYKFKMEQIINHLKSKIDAN